MGCSNFEELKRHIGHKIKCVGYMDGPFIMNVSVECETCSEVLMDFDDPEENEEVKT